MGFPAQEEVEILLDNNKQEEYWIIGYIITSKIINSMISKLVSIHFVKQSRGIYFK